jgi:hypothetical protein
VLKFDESVCRPERFLQFFPRYNLTGALHKKRKHLKGLFLEFDFAPVLAQFPGSEIRFE